MKKTQILSLIVFVFLLASCASGPSEVPPPSAKEWGNKTCPVMAGEPVRTDLSTVYKGKRLFFCCKPCIRHFWKNPDKYKEELIKASKLAREKNKQKAKK